MALVVTALIVLVALALIGLVGMMVIAIPIALLYLAGCGVVVLIVAGAFTIHPLLGLLVLGLFVYAGLQSPSK